MKITRIFLLTVAVSVMISEKSEAQETTENSLDTLAKSVQNLTDEMNKMKRLKITGYIQPQWQYIDSAGAPSFAGGDFTNGTGKYYSRFTMRRARFKFTYEYKNAELMINTDATERGLAMRETFVRVTDTWVKMFSVIFGLHQIPFGFEVTQSSSVRETPERARYNQTLFSTERDLGVFGIVQFPKTSPVYGLRLDVAAMNGVAGVNPEFDNHKDFLGRLQYAKTTKNEKVSYAVGASYYHGGYRLGNVKDYEFKNINGGNGFVFASDTANYNRVGKRIYMGADFQITFDWKIGITTVRAEYIQGEQPGAIGNSLSPRGVPTTAIYHRNFNGGYFYFIQNIGQSKFQAVLKYDWYDPNVKIAGKEIGKPGTNTGKNVGDIRFDTYGFGINYRLHSNIRLMAYYDYVINEATLIPSYFRDIPDNVVTIRMQYKF